MNRCNSVDDLVEHLANHYTHKVSREELSNHIHHTQSPEFGLDDVDGQITIIPEGHSASAKIDNAHQLNLSIVEYDRIMTLFKDNQKRCDFLMTTECRSAFILGELKDRTVEKCRKAQTVRHQAIQQLEQTVTTLYDIPSIKEYIETKCNKSCVYFNKQASAPSPITATEAFNRRPESIADFQLENKMLNKYGFELYECTGNHYFKVSEWTTQSPPTEQKQ